jgi:hypothetical protein
MTHPCSKRCWVAASSRRFLLVRSRITNSQDMSAYIFNEHLAHIPHFISRRFGNLHHVCQALLIQSVRSSSDASSRYIHIPGRAGLHPKTPDSLPLLCPIPSLGECHDRKRTWRVWHLNAITGKTIAELVMTGQVPEIIRPFISKESSVNDHK